MKFKFCFKILIQRIAASTIGGNTIFILFSTIWEKANGIFRTFFIIHEHSFSRIYIIYIIIHEII